MADLTREQIEARIAVLDRLVENEPQHSVGWQRDAIAYRMALRALNAEKPPERVKADHEAGECGACEALGRHPRCVNCNGTGKIGGG